jgi:hypothetical protein
MVGPADCEEKALSGIDLKSFALSPLGAENLGRLLNFASSDFSGMFWD